ncbi:MAG: hypothetical protein ACE367_21675 [Acidimicrobiales bacterium]
MTAGRPGSPGHRPCCFYLKSRGNGNAEVRSDDQRAGVGGNAAQRGAGGGAGAQSDSPLIVNGALLAANGDPLEGVTVTAYALERQENDDLHMVELGSAISRDDGSYELRQSGAVSQRRLERNADLERDVDGAIEVIVMAADGEALIQYSVAMRPADNGRRSWSIADSDRDEVQAVDSLLEAPATPPQAAQRSGVAGARPSRVVAMPGAEPRSVAVQLVLPAFADRSAHEAHKRRQPPAASRPSGRSLNPSAAGHNHCNWYANLLNTYPGTHGTGWETHQVVWSATNHKKGGWKTREYVRNRARTTASVKYTHTRYTQAEGFLNLSLSGQVGSGSISFEQNRSMSNTASEDFVVGTWQRGVIQQRVQTRMCELTCVLRKWVSGFPQLQSFPTNQQWDKPHRHLDSVRWKHTGWEINCTTPNRMVHGGVAFSVGRDSTSSWGGGFKLDAYGLSVGSKIRRSESVSQQLTYRKQPGFAVMWLCGNNGQPSEASKIGGTVPGPIL